MAQQWGSLSKNLDWLREQFGGSVDFYVKEAQLCGARCAVCLCDDLAGIEIAWNMLLRPLQYEKECFGGRRGIAAIPLHRQRRGIFAHAG